MEYCNNPLLNTKLEEKLMNHLLMPLMLALFISACGKTGDLYLPDKGKDAAIEKTPVVNSGEANRGSL